MEKIFLDNLQTLDGTDPNDRKERFDVEELLALFKEGRAKGASGDEALKKMLGRFSLGMRGKVSLNDISEAVIYLLDRDLFVDAFRNGVALDVSDCYDLIESFCVSKILLAELQHGSGALLFFLQVNFKTNIYYVKLAIEFSILAMLKVNFDQFIDFYKDGTKAPGEMLRPHPRAECEDCLVRIIQKKGGGGMALDHDRRFGHLDKAPVRTIEEVYQLLRDIADKIRLSDQIIPELMPEQEVAPGALQVPEQVPEKTSPQVPPQSQPTPRAEFKTDPQWKLETDVGIKLNAGTQSQSRSQSHSPPRSELSEEEKMRAVGEATSFTTSISDRNLEQAFKILGMEPSADPDLIKKRYHQLAMKYHPDRFKDIDKDTVLWQKSQRNFSIILKAYSIIRAYLDKR